MRFRDGLGLLLLVGLSGCGDAIPRPADSAVPSNAQAERDEIFTLLAYSVVLKDWQGDVPDKRGHNIGAVLVDASGTNAVAWGRNCNNILRNGTQHAESRAMIDYLDESRLYGLAGHTLYTTLEPCAQCAGMMLMQRVERAVYGQTDPDYGGVLDRLDPYPHVVRSDRASTPYAQRLDDAFTNQTGEVVSFLRGEAARRIYEDARSAFGSYDVQFPENEGALSAAQRFLDAVPDYFVPIDPDI
jgi:tRNA(Arg) A34 adenosine deaminase TadA